MKTKAIGILAALLWYCIAAAVSLFFTARILIPAYFEMECRCAGAVLAFCGTVVALTALIAAFILVHLLVRQWWIKKAEASRAPLPSAFPAHVTLLVAGLLIFLLAANIAAFLLVWTMPRTRYEYSNDLRLMAVTALAGGLGSCVATILGYLLHASEKKDFDTAYSAWYVGRPLLGLLLGFIFYFVVKGGLLVVAMDGADMELNDAGMAAIGSFVGLFSKNAVEKLRELFNTLFQTKYGMSAEILDKLPPDLKKKVAEQLKGGKTKA
jgi:hypothetical protein